MLTPMTNTLICSLTRIVNPNISMLDHIVHRGKVWEMHKFSRCLIIVKMVKDSRLRANLRWLLGIRRRDIRIVRVNLIIIISNQRIANSSSLTATTLTLTSWQSRSPVLVNENNRDDCQRKGSAPSVSSPLHKSPSNKEKTTGTIGPMAKA